MVVPVPSANAEVKVEDEAEAVRGAERLAIEEDIGRVAVGQLSEELRDQLPVLPKGLEDTEIEAYVAGRLETPLLLLATDDGLASMQSRHQLDLREIELGDGGATRILVEVAREAVTIDRSAPEVPTLADELGGVERLRAVDRDDLLRAEDQVGAVLEKGGEAPSELLARKADDSTLHCVAVEGVPVHVDVEAGRELESLTTRNGFTHRMLLSCLRCTTPCTLRGYGWTHLRFISFTAEYKSLFKPLYSTVNAS